MKTTIYKNSILLITMRTPQALGLLAMSYSLLHREKFLSSLTDSPITRKLAESEGYIQKNRNDIF